MADSLWRSPNNNLIVSAQVSMFPSKKTENMALRKIVVFWIKGRQGLEL
jgi:hypothetical protein